MKLIDTLPYQEVRTKKVRYTWKIPICPYCYTGTKRALVRRWGESTFHPPLYDELGTLQDTQHATLVDSWLCTDCSRNYTVSGNPVKGYKYT